VFGVGTVSGVHVLPPSLDVTTKPAPTAIHLEVLEQLTALISGKPAGSVLEFQLLPPFMETAATALRVASPPTAIQSEVVGHETALNAPFPLVAPPGVCTIGVLVSLEGIVHWLVAVDERADFVADGAILPPPAEAPAMVPAVPTKQSPAKTIRRVRLFRKNVTHSGRDLRFDFALVQSVTAFSPVNNGRRFITVSTNHFDNRNTTTHNSCLIIRMSLDGHGTDPDVWVIEKELRRHANNHAQRS